MNKKNLLVFIVFVYFFIELATATTVYNISLSGRDAIINTSIVLRSEEKVTSWDVYWLLPDNSKVLSIKDDKGEIKDYSVYGNNLRFFTNPDRSKIKKVYIDIIIKNVVDSQFEPLYSTTLSLPGIDNEITIVNTRIDGIISGYVSFNFSEKYEDNYAEFIGYGPINFKMFFSSEGKVYDNYVGFSDYDLSVADKLYPIIQSITGIDLPFKRFPVKVISDNRYNEMVKSWSSATHLPGGLILVKESTMKLENNASVVIHETIHGYNFKIFSWQQVNISWFDEGMGKFAEHLADKQLSNVEPELFGGNIIFSADGNRFILKPKGDREKLWQYYQKNENFMETWNLDQDENRDFGYAFSELVIRDFVIRRGVEGLRLTYRDLLNVDHLVNNSEEFNYIMLGVMNYDFKPCYPNDRDGFENCLNQINKFEFFIPNFDPKGLVKIKKEFISESEYKENQILKEDNNTLDNITAVENKTTDKSVVKTNKPFIIFRIIDGIVDFLVDIFTKIKNTFR